MYWVTIGTDISFPAILHQAIHRIDLFILN